MPHRHLALQPDVTGTIHHAHAAFAEQVDEFERPKEDVAPRVTAWESLVHPADMPRVRQALAEHLAGHTATKSRPLRDVCARVGKLGGCDLLEILYVRGASA